jgi:hypothetical protein
MRVQTIVKGFAAILFSLLLVWAQVAPACPASMPAVCVMPLDMGGGADCGCGMPCCAAQPASSPQPAPAVPAPSNFQNQFSFFAPVIAAWTLPENPANLVSPAVASPLRAMAAPIYTRHCTLLL